MNGITGTGYCPDASGECFVNFNGQDVQTSNYKVVQTDYTSYSIVYACAVKQFVWILTREPVISDAEYEEILTIAVKKLPYMNWNALDGREYQGPNCNYPPPVSGSFLQ